MAIKHIDPVYIYNLLHDVQKDYKEEATVLSHLMAERVHLLSKVVESLVDALLELQSTSGPGQEEEIDDTLPREEGCNPDMVSINRAKLVQVCWELASHKKINTWHGAMKYVDGLLASLQEAPGD